MYWLYLKSCDLSWWWHALSDLDFWNMIYRCTRINTGQLLKFGYKRGQNIYCVLNMVRLYILRCFCYDNERTICSHQKLTKHCGMIPCNLIVSFWEQSKTKRQGSGQLKTVTCGIKLVKKANYPERFSL